LTHMSYKPLTTSMYFDLSSYS